MPNISENYYNNSSYEVEKLMNEMNRELMKASDKVFKNIPDDLVGFELEIYMTNKQSQYFKDVDRIINKYEPKIYKAQQRAIKKSGNTFGFYNDSQFKKMFGVD
jgi:hypothetical protein